MDLIQETLVSQEHCTGFEACRHTNVYGQATMPFVLLAKERSQFTTLKAASLFSVCTKIRCIYKLSAPQNAHRFSH